MCIIESGVRIIANLSSGISWVIGWAMVNLASMQQLPMGAGLVLRVGAVPKAFDNRAAALPLGAAPWSCRCRCLHSKGINRHNPMTTMLNIRDWEI